MEMSTVKKKIISDASKHSSVGEVGEKILFVKKLTVLDIEMEQLDSYSKEYKIKKSIGEDAIVEVNEKHKKTTFTQEIKVKDLLSYIRYLEEKKKVSYDDYDYDDISCSPCLSDSMQKFADGMTFVEKSVNKSLLCLTEENKSINPFNMLDLKD